MGLKSPGLKYHLSRRLKDISTPDFITIEIFNPMVQKFMVVNVNPELKSSWLKSLGLKGPGLKLGVEKPGLRRLSTILTSSEAMPYVNAEVHKKLFVVGLKANEA